MAGRTTASARSAVVALVALVVVLGGAGGALAASTEPTSTGGPTAVGTVPPDVAAAFEGEALRRGARTPETQAVRELRAGTVHQVFHFREGFMGGGDATDPVEPTQEWVAGVEGDGAPLGWLRVVSGGRPVMWQPDPQGARGFLASSAGAVVEVPWDGAYFSLVDGVVTPVRVLEWDAGIGPRSLAQVQADFATDRAETAAAYACCRPSDGCSGGGADAAGAAGGGGGVSADCGSDLPPTGVLAFAGMAVALAAGVGGTAVWQRRCSGGGRLARLS